MSAILLVVFFDCEDDIKFCCAFIGGMIITLPPTTTITIATKEIVIAIVMMPIELSDNHICYLSNQENGNNNNENL